MFSGGKIYQSKDVLLKKNKSVFAKFPWIQNELTLSQIAYECWKISFVHVCISFECMNYFFFSILGLTLQSNVKRAVQDNSVAWKAAWETILITWRNSEIQLRLKKMNFIYFTTIDTTTYINIPFVGTDVSAIYIY